MLLFFFSTWVMSTHGVKRVGRGICPPSYRTWRMPSTITKACMNTSQLPTLRYSTACLCMCKSLNYQALLNLFKWIDPQVICTSTLYQLTRSTVAIKFIIKISTALRVRDLIYHNGFVLVIVSSWSRSPIGEPRWKSLIGQAAAPLDPRQLRFVDGICQLFQGCPPCSGHHPWGSASPETAGEHLATP